MKISAVIMASGFSKRMGENKLFLKYKDQTFIENIIFKVIESDFYEINLVTAYDEITGLCNKIDKPDNFLVTINKNPDNGISESIKLGIKYLKPCDAYIFFTADQPDLSVITIKSIMTEAESDNIVVPRYNEKNGSPAAFGKEFYYDLSMLEGDSGGKQIIKKYPDRVKFIDILNAYEGRDIDTKEEFESLISKI